MSKEVFGRQLDEAVAGLITCRSASKEGYDRARLTFCVVSKPLDVQLCNAHVETICQFAYQEGLPASTLRHIIIIVTKPDHLDHQNALRLIQSLYPATQVSSDLVCVVVASLGIGSLKVSTSLQNLLIKWVTMVYEFLEDRSILSSLYGVLFNMLDMSSIRSENCISLFEPC